MVNLKLENEMLNLYEPKRLVYNL